MKIKIENFNKEAVKKMSYAEFAKTHPFLKDQIKPTYELITGEKVQETKESKESPQKKTK